VPRARFFSVAIARFKDLSLGAGDPARLGAFWAAVLCRTWEAQENGDGLLRGTDAAAHGSRCGAPGRGRSHGAA